MNKKEIWDHFGQETREWMANRYFKTTRACLSEDQINHICIEEMRAFESPYDDMLKLLTPESMKLEFGFDCKKNEHPYCTYVNDGSKHRNKDYSQFPEPRGKVIVHCNHNYSDLPFITIEQDGGTRTVYHGLCPSKEFLETILNNIR